jgi:hypothetical protein
MMRDDMHKLSVTTALLCVGGLAAMNCGSDKSPTGPGEPVLAALEIVGPATLPPGGTAQYSLRGRWSDASVREVTTGITWRSAVTAVVSIDPSGRAVAVERGASTITAVANNRSAGKSIQVLPDGTFRLSGRVSETAAAGVPIESALVEADSDRDRLTALTDARGNFYMFGVRPDAGLRVSKDGYTTHEQRLNLTADTDLNVTLALTRPRPVIAGTYVLSIGSAQCEDGSPPPPLSGELRQRTYTADLSQNNERVSVRLSGRDFATDDGGPTNTFSGVVTASGATFELREEYYRDYYYRRLLLQDVVERLTNGSFLLVTGRAVTTLTDSGLAGTLNGSLVNLRTLPAGTVLGRCASSTHAFTLTR